jgi:hypothetical protein
VPCVEIADCRFSGWTLPPHGMTADLALQGRMVYGLPAEMPDEIEVIVSLDGSPVASGSARWVDAVARLGLLPDRAAADRVATGSITELVDCVPGRWLFDFGAVGHISLVVQ